jgi:hypothetical protein
MNGLRAAAMVAVVAGAVGSIYLTLYVGRGGHSTILMGLFVLWDLSPFAALAVVNVVSRSWPVLTRATLYAAMLMVTAGSLAIYGEVAFGPPRPQPAFAFLVVPLASWLLVAMTVAIAGFVSGRRSSHGGTSVSR